jgi:hypothetical protein
VALRTGKSERSFWKNCIMVMSRMKWAGHVARMGEIKNAYRILVEKPEGRRPGRVGGLKVLK